VIRAQVIKMDPTKEQEEFFWQCVGTARKFFNWGLEQWIKKHEAGETPKEADIRKELTAIKEEQFPWLKDIPCGVVKQSIRNMDTAWQNFFKSLKGKRKGRQMERPTFKKKNRAKPSARLDNGPDSFNFSGKSVRLPKAGWIKLKEELRFEGRPLGTRISFVGNQWWLSVQVELPDVVKTGNPESSVGIDLGLTTAVTLSTGEKFDAPKPLKSALAKLRALNKSLRRKAEGSQNRDKAKQRLSRLHWRIAQIRKDWQHKLTTMIAKRFSVVCVEDLNVKGMMANHCLARSISDIGWGAMIKQLGYKCDVVQKVERFYPSSKLCSQCGYKMGPLSLSIRDWTCPDCGCVHDRDTNAAINIKAEGLRLFTVSYTGNNACGVEGSGPARKIRTKPSTVKQESRLSYLDIK
jgi:putative transposase